MWYDRFPHLRARTTRRRRVVVVSRRHPKALLGSPSSSRVVASLASRASSRAHTHRRHRVCDLLRREPKDPVPFPFLPMSRRSRRVKRSMRRGEGEGVRARSGRGVRVCDQCLRLMTTRTRASLGRAFTRCTRFRTRVDRPRPTTDRPTDRGRCRARTIGIARRAPTRERARWAGG